WLVNRLQNVPIRLGCVAVDVASVGPQVRVRLSDGSERTVDHVLLGTGYRVDVSKYGFLSSELVQSMRCFKGYPGSQKDLRRLCLVYTSLVLQPLGALAHLCNLSPGRATLRRL